MSTELPPPPEMAKKNKIRKKNKGNTDNNTKKRKREEDEQAANEAVPDSQPVDRPAKKLKKHSVKHSLAVKPVVPQKDVLESHAPFVRQTTSFYLALSPCAYHFPLEGLCAEHISPLLLTYFPPLKGIVLSYENPRMSEHPSEGVQIRSSDEAKAVLSQSIDEYAVSYVWLTAEFLALRPRRGTYLEGYVSLQNESILGLVCYNYFNAVIEREKLPKDWRWTGDNDQDQQPDGKKRTDSATSGGYFVDAEGKKIDGRIVFGVEDFEATPSSETSAGTVSIIGSLISKAKT